MVLLTLYVYKRSWSLVLTSASYRYFIALRLFVLVYKLTGYVYGVLVTLPCTYMYIPTFMATTANIRQL